jgi:hypothetical protein
MSHFLDAVEGNGNSALWLAAAAGHRDAVAALLQVTTASTSCSFLTLTRSTLLPVFLRHLR